MFHILEIKVHEISRDYEFDKLSQVRPELANHPYNEILFFIFVEVESAV